MDRLEEIEERWAKTTPGPWAVNDANDAGELYVGRANDNGDWFAIVEFTYQIWEERVREDADAIAAAPQDIAWLIAEVKRTREELEQANRNTGIE